MRDLRLAWILLLFITVAGEADAHGPSLHVDITSVMPGSSLTVRGEGITSNGEIRLMLRGVLQDYSLGSVRGDEHGRFETKVTLPSDLKPGEYTLLAAGDHKATATLMVTKPDEIASPEGSAPHAHDAAQAGETERMGHATAEPMILERSTRGAARVLAFGATVASALLGVALLGKR